MRVRCAPAHDAAFCGIVWVRIRATRLRVEAMDVWSTHQDAVDGRGGLVAPVGAAKLLDGLVCAPRQLQCDVKAPLLVLLAAVRLQEGRELGANRRREESIYLEREPITA